MFRPAADRAGDRPVSRRATRKSLGVSDGRFWLQLGPTSNEQRNEHALLQRFRQSLDEGQDFPDIFGIHRLGEFAERGISVTAPGMRQRLLDFGNDVFT